jgi:glycosyltransferase involved in cell wall biosynthesis
MLLAATALGELGHRMFLVHAEPNLEIPTVFSDQLAMPVLFDRWAKLPPPGLTSAREATRRWLSDHHIDVIHVHDWPRTAVMADWTHHVPVVVTVHWALCPNNARYFWKDRRPCDRAIGAGCVEGYVRHGCGHTGDGLPFGLPGFARAMVDDAALRRAIGRAARIVAPSQWMADRLASDGLPAERIEVVHPPISGADDGSSAVPPSSPADPPALLFAGRMVDFKAADQVIAASALVERPHQLWFAGDGVARRSLEDQASRAGIRHRCEFLGAISPAELRGRQEACSIAVIPSLAPENFSMAGAEALMAGRPVVAYDVGGNREWCRDGETGRLISPGDVAAMAGAIDELLGSPDRRDRLGATGRALASAWTPIAHATRLLEVYAGASRSFMRRVRGSS